MKSQFLAAAAAIAFIAAGVAAQAQDTTKHEQRAEPRAGAETGRPDPGAAKAAQAEPRRDETKGNAEGERSRVGEPQAQPRKAAQGQEEPRGEQRKAAQGQEEQRQGAEGKRTAQSKDEKSPAARTGANEPERNGARTGANEPDRNGARTGANEPERNGVRTGENDRDRNGARSAEGHGQARVEGNVKMSAEHANRVGESLRREGHRENVRVRVGERAPENIAIRPLPEDVIAIVPEYRGYDYFIDENDEIVFVAPGTHEVVGMIDYEGRAAADENYTHVSASRPCPTEN